MSEVGVGDWAVGSQAVGNSASGTMMIVQAQVRGPAVWRSVLALGGRAGGGAERGAEFYKGKTVKFIVGVGVGGGFDAYARMLAPHIGRALDATVVVENLPGAGGMLALNQMVIAQPDGLRFKIVNGTPSLLAQILEQDNIKYDLTTMPHLAGVAAEPWGVLVGPTSPIKTPQDLVKPGQKIRWGGTGPTGGPSDGASLTCQALKHRLPRGARLSRQCGDRARGAARRARCAVRHRCLARAPTRRASRAA